MKCRGKYNPVVHVGGELHSLVQDEGKSPGFLEGIKISDLMASMASRLRAVSPVCSLWMMLCRESIGATELGG